MEKMTFTIYSNVLATRESFAIVLYFYQAVTGRQSARIYSLRVRRNISPLFIGVPVFFSMSKDIEVKGMAPLSKADLCHACEINSRIPSEFLLITISAFLFLNLPFSYSRELLGMFGNSSPLLPRIVHMDVPS